MLYCCLSGSFQCDDSVPTTVGDGDGDGDGDNDGDDDDEGFFFCSTNWTKMVCRRRRELTSASRLDMGSRKAHADSFKALYCKHILS